MYRDGMGCGEQSTAAVGTVPANELALYDMAGNVAEWVRDFYTPGYPDCVDGCTDPTGPTDGELRMVRGGSLNDSLVSSFRTARRDQRNPEDQIASMGGRCVKQ